MRWVLVVAGCALLVAVAALVEQIRRRRTPLRVRTSIRFARVVTGMGAFLFAVVALVYGWLFATAHDPFAGLMLGIGAFLAATMFVMRQRIPTEHHH